MKIERSHIIDNTFRVAAIRGQFDFDKETSDHTWNVDMVLPSEWQIGVIVGPSGSGKTTIGKEYFGDDVYFKGYDWDSNSVVDDLDIQQITSAMSSVGFSSPPCWLQPFWTLSNGQKFCVEMARLLFDKRDLVVVDEYTSVVDRTVAQIGSHAIQKYIRRNGTKQIVLLSCHYDILDWIQPDWVYDVSTGETVRGNLWQRPDINIEIFECGKEVWEVFEKHHYLNSNLLPSSKCFVAVVNGQIAAFTCYVPFWGRLRNTMRGHRTVVLPDFQGFGLANILVEYVAEQLLLVNMSYVTTTSHPAMINYRAKNSKWSMRKASHKLGGGSASRLTTSFTYVGDKGFEYLKGW